MVVSERSMTSAALACSIASMSAHVGRSMSGTMPSWRARLPMQHVFVGVGLRVARRDRLLLAAHLGHGVDAARSGASSARRAGRTRGRRGRQQVVREALGGRRHGRSLGRVGLADAEDERRARERRAPGGRPRAGVSYCMQSRAPQGTPATRGGRVAVARPSSSSRSTARDGKRPPTRRGRARDPRRGRRSGLLRSSRASARPRPGREARRRVRPIVDRRLAATSDTALLGRDACGGRSRPYPPAMTAAVQTPEAAKPATAKDLNATLAASAPRRARPGCPRTRSASSRSRSSSGRSASARTRSRRRSRATSATDRSTRRSSPRSSSCSARSGTPRRTCATGWTRRSARRASSSCRRPAASSTSRSASSGSSRRGTTRCRSPSGRSSPPSPPATAR